MTELDEPEPKRCICDGGAYLGHMPVTWRPFILDPECLVHGATPLPVASDTVVSSNTCASLSTGVI